MLAAFSKRRRGGSDIVGRVFMEEPVGFEQEADVGRGHDRIVFRARHMGVAEGVPEDDVFIGNVAVGAGPSGQSVFAAALIGIIAGGESFVGAGRCDPDVMGDEAGAPAPPCVAGGEGERVVAGEELVSDGLAQRILDVGIDELPGPAGFEIEVGEGFLLGLEIGGFEVEGIFEGVRVVDGIGHGIELLDGARLCR